MVGRQIQFKVDKEIAKPGETVLKVENLTLKSKHSTRKILTNISFEARRGEILCIAGIDGNGQSQLVHSLTGLIHPTSGTIKINGEDITRETIRKRSIKGMSHIPEDRHKHGLILDYDLSYNLVMQTYFTNRFQKYGFLKFNDINKYSDELIEKYDIRSGQGRKTMVRSMSGGNQQKIIVAREIDKDPEILVAVQPTRGLDVGAIEYIHKQLIRQRDAGKAVLLISLELEEVMSVSDRILVIYEGEIVADLDPEKTTEQELGLYMAGAKREVVS
jgi:general nucleoside transport system ATP-binding protein